MILRPDGCRSPGYLGCRCWRCYSLLAICVQGCDWTILKMVLGLMQSILSFVLGLLPLPDVPAWLVELTETILGYMKTGMGIVLFFVPQVVLEGALDLIIVVWTVVHGYKLVMFNLLILYDFVKFSLTNIVLQCILKVSLNV